MRNLRGFRPTYAAVHRREPGRFSLRAISLPPAMALLAAVLVIAPVPTSVANAAVGDITTVVSGDGVGDTGPAIVAGLTTPSGVAVDTAGNLYVADTGHNRIRRVDATTGIITTVAGTGSFGFNGDNGPATSAQLNSPRGVALDTIGNLFIADTENNRIRRVDATTRIITTIAGTGAPAYNGDNIPATTAQLANPEGIAVDAIANLYIADTGSHRIRRVDATTGTITTITGTGTSGYNGDNIPATTAQVAGPRGVAVGATGNLFIADTDNNRIRRIDATTGIITTIAGTGTFGYNGDNIPATTAQVAGPRGVAVGATGNLFIADTGSHRIRRVDATTGTITTIAGTGTYGYGSSGDNGPATDATLSSPGGLAVDATGNLSIADTGIDRVRRVDATTGIITTIAGTSYYTGDGGPATNAALYNSRGVAFDTAGNLYIADNGVNRIRRVDATTGVITTVAGTGENWWNYGFSGDNGPATAATLHNPVGIAVDTAGNLYIADTQNQRIRRIDAATGIITTIAGTGNYGYNGDNVPATNASLDAPLGVAVDTAGNLYIADTGNNRIRRVDAATRIITTIAGTGTFGSSGDNGPASNAQLTSPRGIAVDTIGNLYIADTDNNRVRRVDAATGIITTIAGTGTPGYNGDNIPATTAQLAAPYGIAVDATGNLFIADTGSHRIRRIDVATGVITTIAGTGTSGYSGDNGPAIAANLATPEGIAVDAVGNVSFTDTGNNRIRKVILSAAAIPSAPTKPTVAAGNASISVTWSAPAANGSPITGYTATATPGGATCSTTGALTCTITGLTNGTAHTVAVTATNAVGTGPASPASNPATPTAPTPPTPPASGGLVAQSPARLFDTRPGEPDGTATVTKQPVAGGTILEVQLAGNAGMPATGIGSVALNVTVDQPATTGYITAYPCGTRPLASNLNYRAGQTIANTVITPVSDTGTVCFYAHGTTHLIADLTGWFPTGQGPTSTGPNRLFDTRPGEPDGTATVTKQPVAGGTILEVQLAGNAGMPATGIGSVALNVTVDQPTANGYITAYPCGTRPLASNLNYTAGQTIANTVITPVSATGTVCFYAHGTTHLIADLTGWFPTGQGPTSTGPNRLFDTRPGEPAGAVTVTKQAVTGGTIVEVQMTGNAGIPTTGVGTVAMNVTVDQPTANGYITAYPCGTRPTASNLNYTAGQTIANTVITPVDANGKVCFYAHGTTHLIADLTGWFPTVVT